MSIGAIIGLVVGLVVLLLILLVVFYVIGTYNSFVGLKNGVDEAYSTMDVYMKKRYDMIPNLVNTVKGYAKHESSTLENVMKARNSCMSANDPEEKAKNENILTGTLKTLFSVVESYPELKADKNFAQLMSTLEKLEEDILKSRKYYNGVVKQYNTKREKFPSNIIAGCFNFEKKVLFELDSVDERKTPQVDF